MTAMIQYQFPFQHPALMVLFVIVISLLGYGLARLYLHYSKMQIAKRLSPPKSLAMGKGEWRPIDNNTTSINHRTLINYHRG